MHWFTKDWWSYLLLKREGSLSVIKTAICRAKGHPCGVWFYSNKEVPDMRCKNCGDDLG